MRVQSLPIDHRDCLPDGRPDRQGRRHPATHQPALAAHAAITNALDAGVPLRDAQILARHGVHFLTAYVAGV